MTRPVRRSALVGAALLAALALAGCGEKRDALKPTAARTQPLKVMLDGPPGADQVGLYEAQASGGFTQAGLNVRLQTPAEASAPLQMLESGKVDVAIASEPALLRARDKGAALAAIGAITQQPLTSIVSPAAGKITKPAQLRGKRMGEDGSPDQHAFLTAILQHAGVPPSSVKEVNVGANPVPALLSGRVDAALGAWNDAAVQLALARKRPNVIRMQNAGIPAYDELVLVTTEAEIGSSNNKLRRFVQAAGRGYAAVRSDPSSGVRALTHVAPSLSAKLQLASIRATLPAFFPHDPAKPNLPWGWQDASQWIAFGKWMLSRHLISNPATVVAAETNQLLAGQGP